MTEKVITKGPDEHYLETDNGTLQKISVSEAKAITGFENVEEVPLGGQFIGGGKYFESDGGNISRIIPADN
jgi:hypothetical protein